VCFGWNRGKSKSLHQQYDEGEKLKKFRPKSCRPHFQGLRVRVIVPRGLHHDTGC